MTTLWCGVSARDERLAQLLVKKGIKFQRRLTTEENPTLVLENGISISGYNRLFPLLA